MPEGPELHLASKFVNLVCKGRIFDGPIVKSDVSKHADISWTGKQFGIVAESRGKEMKLTLKSLSNLCKDLDIVFQFGMSGKFDFYEASELKKHAHLNFFTADDPKMVLSFVDYRRFGKWQVGTGWSTERGPCVIKEYNLFRENVLKHLEESVFNKAICEVLLNQKYFNGIGNYLRAEILHRLKIPPFTKARCVLEPLLEIQQMPVKKEEPDILDLCHLLPNEVVNLGCTGYDPEGRDADYSKFTDWLQCYYNPNMKNMADHNKRTIWFDGPAGPLAPKEGKSRKMKISKINTKKKKENKEQNDDDMKTEIKKEYTAPKHATRRALKQENASAGAPRAGQKRQHIKQGREDVKDTGKMKKRTIEKVKVEIKPDPDGAVAVKNMTRVRKNGKSKQKCENQVKIETDDRNTVAKDTKNKRKKHQREVTVHQRVTRQSIKRTNNAL